MSARYPNRDNTNAFDRMRQAWIRVPEILKSMGYDDLRPGQQPVVCNILAGKDTLCVLPTGTGKTACFVVPTLALDWRTVVFSPLVALMRDQVQSLNRLRIPAMALSSMQSDSENNYAMEQWALGKLSFLYVAPERLHNQKFKDAMDNTPPDMVVLDECFTPDTEILTENGFVKFADLKEGVKVAQVWADKGCMDFVEPTAIICKPFAGDMIRLHSQQLCDLTMTPNHELLAYYSKGVVKKEAVHNISLNYLKRFKAAVPISGGDARSLTSAERLKLAYQADGSAHYINSSGVLTSASFSFVKKRKIERFLSLCKDCDYTVSEVNDSKEGRRRFLVTGDIASWSKNLEDMFSIEHMSAKLAADFVEEASLWDGSKCYVGQLYYSSTVERNTDFVQTVAVLAGYKTNKVVQHDNRSETFSDVHRLFISTGRDWIGAQCLTKDFVPYTGDVHCVRVPAGNIVVRGAGKTMVVGNCHTLSQWSENFRSSYCKVGDFIAEKKPKVVAAFTATCPAEVEADVRRVLGISNADRLVYYPRRTNLTLESRELENMVQIADVLRQEITGSAIVYCSTVTRTEETAATLGNLMQEEVVHFHGQLNDSEKRTNMDLFMSDKVRVVCATNAFGMGVDKANVRGVIHRDIPGCIEALSQETGRAGRDGKDSLCITYYSPESLKTQKFFIECGNPSPQEIRQVFNTLKKSSDRAGNVEMTVSEIGQHSGVYSWKVSTIMEILKANAVIERIDNKQKLFRVRRVVQGTTSDNRFNLWWNIIDTIGVKTADGFLEVDMPSFVQQTGLSEPTVRNWLKKWQTGDVIRYVPPFAGSPTKITGALNMIDFTRLEGKLELAYDKLNKVLEYADIPNNDKHEFLENYFAHTS